MTNRNKEDQVKFGKALSNLRKGRGLSQEGLAKVLNFHQPYISQIEHGVRRPPSIMVSAFCDKLKLAPRDRKRFQRMGAKTHGWEI